jgi:hypothetical protein
MARRIVMLGLAVASALLCGAARADHACDALGEEGWSTVPSHEVVGVKDGAPYPEGADWFVERTTTMLAFCNYINAVGNYSLRSYSLSPEDVSERVAICRAGTPVAPYAGACPPR